MHLNKSTNNLEILLPNKKQSITLFWKLFFLLFFKFVTRKKPCRIKFLYWKEIYPIRILLLDPDLMTPSLKWPQRPRQRQQHSTIRMKQIQNI